MKTANAYIVAAMLFVAAGLCLLAGCDQPPAAIGGRLPDKPTSVTADVATAGESAERVAVLVEEIRDTAKTLTAATADTLGPRIEQRADEALDETRSVQATLAGVAAASRENDKRLDAIVKEFERLQAANARLAEDLADEKAAGNLKLKLMIGGFGGVVFAIGMILSVTGNPKFGVPVAVVGLAGVGVAMILNTLAWIVGIGLAVALVGAIVWLVRDWTKDKRTANEKLAEYDDELRRTVQGIVGQMKLNPLATVQQVYDAVKLQTGKLLADIERDERQVTA